MDNVQNDKNNTIKHTNNIDYFEKLVHNIPSDNEQYY
jgi:hypothetical protein